MATWGSYFASYVKKADVPIGGSPSPATSSPPSSIPTPASSSSPAPKEQPEIDEWKPVEIASTAPILIAPTFTRTNSGKSTNSGTEKRKLYDMTTPVSSTKTETVLPQRAVGNAARVANLFGYAKGTGVGGEKKVGVVERVREREEERKGGIVAESVYGTGRGDGGKETGDVVVGRPLALFANATIVGDGDEPVVEKTKVVPDPVVKESIPQAPISLPSQEAPRMVDQVSSPILVIPEAEKAPMDTKAMLEAFANQAQNLSNVNDMFDEPLIPTMPKAKPNPVSKSKKKGASALDMLDFFASQAEDVNPTSEPNPPLSAKKTPSSTEFETKEFETQPRNAEKILATPLKRDRSLEMLDFFADQAMSAVSEGEVLSQQLPRGNQKAMQIVVGNTVPLQVGIEEIVVPIPAEKRFPVVEPRQLETLPVPVVDKILAAEPRQLETKPPPPVENEQAKPVPVPVKAAEPVVKSSKWTFGFGKKQTVPEAENNAAVAPIPVKIPDEKLVAKPVVVVIAPAAIAPPSFKTLDEKPASSQRKIAIVPPSFKLLDETPVALELKVAVAPAAILPPLFKLLDEQADSTKSSLLLVPTNLAPKIISPKRRSASAALGPRFPAIELGGLARSNTTPSRPSFLRSQSDAQATNRDEIKIDIDFRELFLEYEKQAEKIQREKEQMEAESARMADEMLMFQQEADRIAGEEESMKRFVESLESERLRDEENEERKKREREARLEAERKERERIEYERLEKERLAREEEERLVREEEERVRIEREEAKRVIAVAEEEARREKEEAEQLIARTVEREKRDRERKEAQQRALVEEETKRSRNLDEARKRKMEAQLEAERVAQEEIERLNADMLRYVAEAETGKNTGANRYAEQAEEDRLFMEEELEREQEWEDGEKRRKIEEEAESLEDERREEDRLRYEEEQEMLEDERLEEERLQYEEEQERLEDERLEAKRIQFEEEQEKLAIQREEVERRERQERRKAKQEAERLQYEREAAEEAYYAEQDRRAVAEARRAEMEEDEESEDEIVKAERKIKEAFAGLAKERGESPGLGKPAAASVVMRANNMTRVSVPRGQDRDPPIRQRDGDERVARNNNFGARRIQPQPGRGDAPRARPQIKEGLPSGPRRRR